MSLIIGSLIGLGHRGACGPWNGLEDDLGLGVGSSYKPCWDHINSSLL